MIEEGLPFKQWDDKSSCLAGASAGHAHHILPLQDQRKGLALNGSGQPVAFALYASQNLGTQTQSVCSSTMTAFRLVSADMAVRMQGQEVRLLCIATKS